MNGFTLNRRSFLGGMAGLALGARPALRAGSAPASEKITLGVMGFRGRGGGLLAGFLDIGSLTNNFSQISTISIRTSAGVGIRYLTPVGPLRLDWGFPLDRKPTESRSRVHFTFGYVF